MKYFCRYWALLVALLFSIAMIFFSSEPVVPWLQNTHAGLLLEAIPSYRSQVGFAVCFQISTALVLWWAIDSEPRRKRRQQLKKDFLQRYFTLKYYSFMHLGALMASFYPSKGEINLNGREPGWIPDTDFFRIYFSGDPGRPDALPDPGRPDALHIVLFEGQKQHHPNFQALLQDVMSFESYLSGFAKDLKQNGGTLPPGISAMQDYLNRLHTLHIRSNEDGNEMNIYVCHIQKFISSIFVHDHQYIVDAIEQLE